MNKYHVKFSHIVQLPISNQTDISIKIVDVDEVYEVESHVDIFALIYARFNVVGSITVIAQEYLIPNEIKELNEIKEIENV